MYAKQPFTIGVDNNINCYNSEKKDLDKKYKIIKKNLDKYDQKFLKKINLKYIVLCEDLSISKINTAGIPDNVMKTLILDIKFNERYFERVIHHEVFHIINDSYKELFNEKLWSLNFMSNIKVFITLSGIPAVLIFEIDKSSQRTMYFKLIFFKNF